MSPTATPAEVTYTVHIGSAEEGAYDVFVPALHGCVTQGETFEEAVIMVQEAIEGFPEALVLEREPIPTEPST